MDTFDRIAVSIWDIMIAEDRLLRLGDDDDGYCEMCGRSDAAPIAPPPAAPADGATIQNAAGQEPTAEMYAAGYTKYVELSNLQGYITWRNIKECFAAMLTAAAPAPASPLLPGLERAAEIAQRAWPVGTAAEAIRAEISRLKGEGRGS